MTDSNTAGFNASSSPQEVRRTVPAIEDLGAQTRRMFGLEGPGIFDQFPGLSLENAPWNRPSRGEPQSPQVEIEGSTTTPD